MKQLISDRENWLCLSVIILAIIVGVQGKQIKLLHKALGDQYKIIEWLCRAVGYVPLNKKPDDKH